MRARVATSLAAASALLAAGLVTPTVAQAAPQRVGLAKSTPDWLGHARHLGKPSNAGRVDIRIYLTPNGGIANLKAAVARASTPGSAGYRKFVSAAQYHAAYDPSAASVAAVSKWLASAGLKVTGHADYNSYLRVSGSVAAAQAAFGTTIQTYSHDGQTVQANSSVLTMPTSVASAVLSVSGIDTTTHLMKKSSTPIPPPDAFQNGRPCSLTYGQLLATKQADYRTPLPIFKGKALPYAVCGYTGPQFRAGYGVDNSGMDGTGVTVAITDAYNSPTMLADAKTYAASHGDAGWAPGQYTTVQPKAYNSVDACDASGWFGEQTLDVEAVHAMASNAKVRYYASASCYDADFIDTLAKVVNENKAQLVTNSWGDLDQVESADNIAAYETVFLQGALEGISFLFSSGDNGDEVANSGIKQTDYPASDPYVTAVGGTSTAINSDGKIAFNAGWGTQKYTLAADAKSWSPLGYLYGAGGGYSTLFNRPTYQNGVVPASAPGGRAVPDVAMDADPTTGMLIGETQTYPDGSVHYGEFRIGGTSLASPLFAGMSALLLQHAGGPLGLLNPTIYSQYHSSLRSFNDVTNPPRDAGNVRVDYVNGIDANDGLVYSVRTFGQNSSLTTVPGYDTTTGIGVPNSRYILSVSPIG